MTTEHMPATGGRTVADPPKPPKEPEETTPGKGRETDTPDRSVPNKVTKTTEELPVSLNDVEWQNRAREMAAASKAVEEAEQRKKAITSQAGSDVKTAQAKRDKLVDIVSTRTEMREVTVETVYDYEAGSVTRKRTDNGEVLSVRDMIDAERQGSLMDANSFIEEARDAEFKEDEAAEAEMDADDIDEDMLDDDDEDDGPLDEDPLSDRRRPRED